MAAGRTTKDVVFTAKMRDATGPGFDSIKRKSKAASVEMARTTGALVSDKTGRAMSQFNERTEKMRQLVLLSSSGMGNLAGSMVYYGGTLSYVIGIFKPWQIALLAAAVAVGLLGKLLLEESERMKEWRKQVKKSKEETKALLEQVGSWLIMSKRMREGWTEEEQHLSKVQDKIFDVRWALMQLTAQEQVNYDKLNAIGKLTYKQTKDDLEIRKGYTDQLSVLRAREVDIVEEGEKKKHEAMDKAAQERWDKEAEEAKRRAEQRRKELEQLAAFQRAKVAAFTKGLKLMLAAERQAEVERTARFIRINEAVRAYLDRQQEIRDIAFQRKYEGIRAERAIEANENMKRFDAEEKARQDAIDRERAAAEQRMEYAAMGADAMITLFSAIASGSAQQVADTLKTMAFEALARAAWHGIMAVAASFLNPVAVGKHMTLAGLYAGFAATYGAGALAASGMAGGGGGGGGGIGGGGYDISQRAGHQERGEEDQKTYAVFYVYGHQFFGNDVRGDRDLNDRVVRYKESQNPGRESDRF